MWSFFGELLRRSDGPCTIIVMDDEYRAQPRQYLVHPQRILIFLGMAALTLALLVASLMGIQGQPSLRCPVREYGLA